MEPLLEKSESAKSIQRITPDKSKLENSIQRITPKKSASKKSTPKKSASKKSASKKSTPKKSASEKSTSKKSTSEKSASEKSSAKTHKSEKSIQRITKKNPIAVINNFMRKVDPHKRRALFLRSICSDAGVCIAFGKELKTINKHFDGFVNFEHIKWPIKNIGTPSDNGFVNELTYEHNGYIANAVLKSTSEIDSDNLLYEYLVGQYINKQCRIFPCFVETYGWFTYKTPAEWEIMRRNSHNLIDIPSTYLQLQPSVINDNSLEIACSQSNYLAILIQHIKDANSLESMSKTLLFVKYHLPQVLYQIYMPLSTLAKTFSHYDLHLNNVLIYEPVKGQYIDYHYKLIDGTSLRFKSPYIAKIIDYGRSFFKDKDSKVSSKSLHAKICKTKKCNPHCGHDFGFTILNPEDFPGSFFYISSSKRNMSHDLRLMNDLLIRPRQESMILNYNPTLYSLLKKVLYGNGITRQQDKLYGTMEQTRSGLPAKIVNVNDAELALRRFLSESNHDESKYDKMKSLGTLTIHQDGTPMTFSPTP